MAMVYLVETEVLTMSLNLNPDIEARLNAMAQASGITVKVFLERIVEERSGLSSTQRLSPKNWAAQFEEWADSFPKAAAIPDEALSRENLFPDRLTGRMETFFSVLPDSVEAFRAWRRLVVSHEVKGVKVHDTRFVSIMEVHGVKHLLTFNTADFRRFENVITLHPASVAA